METVKSRSESPFSRSKAKSQFSDAAENGNLVIEQMKSKRKNLKNKAKSQANDKENEDIRNSEKDFFEEKPSINEAGSNGDSNNDKDEIKINNGHDVEITNGREEVQKLENKESDALIHACEVAEEKIANELNNQTMETETTEDSVNTDSVKAASITEDCPQQSNENIFENQTSTQEDDVKSSGLRLNFEADCESTTEKCNGETYDSLMEETNISKPEEEEEETIKECLKSTDSSQISVNGSENSSHYEEANIVEDYIQSSPDTATKDEESFANKITHFFGKFSHLHEQKEDSEVSSSKKSESTLNHPYLSKVSGRRGIKDRLNSSATVISSREMEVKTPEHAGISLDDSFRVRTNPPCLSSVNLIENPTLRKFKGKRCLNTGEPDDEDDMHTSLIKRRKLDDKTQESGILGSILWSPFKKKSLDNEDQLKLATTESKLSRLLSPFWFWKKTSTGQKGK